MRPLDLARNAFLFTSLFTSATFALSPDTLLFQENFESLSDIQQLGGTCTIASTACDVSVLVAGNTGNAIQFKKTNFPLLSFPVSNGENTYINPLKGTIVFNYVASGAPDGDWGSGQVPTSKKFFHLRDPNVSLSRDQTLNIGTYVDTSSNKQYLYFRYDATSGCISGTQSPYDCQRVNTTGPSEPGVVMQWQPNTAHKIMASWDFTATKPYMALFVDGNFARVIYTSATIGLDGFNPTQFYVGSMIGNSGTSAQGSIDNLSIYSDVALDPNNPVPAYIEQTKNDGTWQPHEIASDTTDAPAPLNLSGQPFIFYPSYGFEPIYEGSIPTTAIDSSGVVIHVAKNQRETAFFNIYAGETDLNTVTASVSNLVNNSNALDQSKIKIRTVKNWWQAGKAVFKEIIPVYTPELLLYDDTRIPQCTGPSPHPCSNAQFPSDPPSTTTKTTVKAHTSRQFAITLDIPANAVPGDYSGTITVTSAVGTKTQPIRVIVHDFALPEIDKTVALYNHSRFDIANKNDMYLTSSMYQQQLQNMKAHGVNGVLYYGETWDYPFAASAVGLNKFGGYIYNPSSSVSASGLVGYLSQYGFAPYLYGQDEPHLNNGANIPTHLAKSKNIHAAQGKVVVAINKQWADNFNNPAFFPYMGYTYDEGKLDLPNLAIEDGDSTTRDYISGLLNGTATKAENPEVYYWQMDREDSRINRFYAGYYLWLTDLSGIFPYVYQKLINDPFNDFDQASSNGERDLNVVYPSLEGGIDTVEWEAFRAGLDDYRLLQLWKNLYNELNALNPDAAATHKVTIDSLVAKYRSAQAFSTQSRETFANDRKTLIDEIDSIVSDLDSDHDGINNNIDNCPTITNPSQTDINGNGAGDACEHGLTGAYYNNKDLSGSAALTRIDSTVNFNWGSSSPGISGISSDNFSVRWTGKVMPPVTGTYKFCARTDDGVRLSVNGQTLVDHWKDQSATERCGNIALTQGQAVPIQMDYYEKGGDAVARLRWAYPTGKESRIVVPAAQLYAQ